MQWHEFAFSQKPFYRLQRHSVFWVTWWMYFSCCYYLYQQTAQNYFVTVGSWIILKVFLLILIEAIACYTFIYVLLPQLIKGKWLKVMATFLPLCAILFAA